MKAKKATAVILTAAMFFSMAGCGTSSTTGTVASSTAEAVSSIAETTEEVTSSAAVTGDTRTVKDSEGNDVTIPAEITKVAPAIGAFAQVTEMLSTGKIVAAATSNLSDKFKSVFTDYTESNPNNYDATSVEDVIASGAQVVYGPSAIYTDEQKEQLGTAGVAFVSINKLATTEDMLNAFTIIGEILGDDSVEKAREFCDYYEEQTTAAQEATKDIADSDKVTVLRLSLNGGNYSTINKTDIFNDMVNVAGGVMVSADYEQTGGKGGNTSLSVDAEQVLAWNPQIIFTLDQVSAAELLKDSALQEVDAVKNQRVYVCPTGLYLWGVRSGENAMMPQWMGQKLYSDRFLDVNMTQIVKDFYEKWYKTTISDEEAEAVLAGASEAQQRGGQGGGQGGKSQGNGAGGKNVGQGTASSHSTANAEGGSSDAASNAA